jgi:hypothetical protein
VNNKRRLPFCQLHLEALQSSSLAFGNGYDFGVNAMSLCDCDMTDRAVYALLFPVMLKHTAHIESPDPVSGDKIQVTVTPDGVQKVKPESAVASSVNSVVDLPNIRGSICHYVHFFSSSKTASKWIAEHPGKKMTFYSVIDAFHAAKRVHNKYSEMQTEDVCCRNFPNRHVCTSI